MRNRHKHNEVIQDWFGMAAPKHFFFNDEEEHYVFRTGEYAATRYLIMRCPKDDDWVNHDDAFPPLEAVKIVRTEEEVREYARGDTWLH